MAITITQQPTYPAAAYSDMIYVVSSNNGSRDQFKYVVDIKDEDDNLLTRLKQSKNPSGYGVFNVGRMLSNYLDYKLPMTIVGTGGNVIIGDDKGVKKFLIKFGEEWALNPTGSSLVYNGINDTVGLPSKIGDDSVVYPFVVERTSGDFNFNPSPYLFNDVTATYWSQVDIEWALNSNLWGEAFSLATNNSPILSNRPYKTVSTRKPIAIHEYETISVLNGVWESGGSITAENIFLNATVKFYDEDGTVIQIPRLEDGSLFTDTLWLAQNSTDNTNCGPWGTASATNINYTGATYNSVLGSLTTPMQLLHIGVGPRNMLACNKSPLSNSTTYNWSSLILGDEWEYYEVILSFKETSSTATTGSVSLIYERQECQVENSTRFAFINKLGVMDYFTANASGDKKGSVNRETYDKTYVNYSTTGGTISYNSQNRGTTQYYTELEDSYTAETDWLTKEQADWITELFESPLVFIQDNSQFIPVVVTSNNFDYNISERGQKIFRYSIKYKYSNSKRNI